jgi:hypothetical protein
MEEAGVGGDKLFIASDEPPKMPQPGKGPFDNPAPSIPPRFPANQTAPIRGAGASTAGGPLEFGKMDTHRSPLLCGQSSPRRGSSPFFLDDSWRDNSSNSRY